MLSVLLRNKFVIVGNENQRENDEAGRKYYAGNIITPRVHKKVCFMKEL